MKLLKTFFVILLCSHTSIAQSLYRTQFNGGYAAALRSETIAGEAFGRSFSTTSGSGSESILFTASLSSPLPATILSFSGSIKGDEVLLRWNVADERNVVQYEVEVSEDTDSFTLAHKILPLAKAGAYTQFHIQKQPVLYYRLRIVKNDGQANYATIIRLFKVGAASSFSFFPNPASQVLNVESLEQRQLTMVDIYGRVVKSLLIKPGHISFDIGDLGKGMYFLKDTLTGVTHKLIKR